MDRAARNFLMMAGITISFAVYGICGLAGYGIVPLVDGRDRGGAAGVLLVLALGVLLVLAIARGGRTLWRRAAATRELCRRLDGASMDLPERLRVVARQAGLSDRVVLLDSTEPYSFVYGLSTPKVVISRALFCRLSTVELRAALEHERYHVKSLDPLRDALTDAALDAMFFLPALRTLGARYAAARELAADCRAVSLVGSRPLAGALLKAMEGPPSEPPATIPLAAGQLIGARLAQLETGREPNLVRVSLGAIGGTVIGAGAFIALLVAVPFAMGGGAELTQELGPASLLEGASYCLLPIAVGVAVIYRHLSSRGIAQ